MATRDLEDGESCEMQGSGAKPYSLKNTGGVYSCSCPAWRNQSVPIESRTCKHLRKLRGDEAEKARVGTALPPKPKSAAKKDAPPLLLAHSWDGSADLTGWWLSEKLDGVRAYWTGSKFLSRLGNEYHAPEWFTTGLPTVPLDGELWLGRGAFQRTVSIVRRQDKSEHWKAIQFVVFDAPAAEGPFEDRHAFLRSAIGDADNLYASVLDQDACKGEQHLRERLEEVEAQGGEGLMLREPGSAYEVGRSTTLLKVKSFHDGEAEVMAHSAGKGKHKGRTGALVVRLANGTEFNVGTGLSDAERKDPPPIGSTITFRYQELTDAGVPRFPTFVRVHPDSEVPPNPAGKKQAESSEVPAGAQAPAEAANGSVQYFEFKDDKSAKFWEIQRSGSDVTVRYGRIGAEGQTKTKSFADETKAEAHRAKLVQDKTRKGYASVAPSADQP